jgi:hypothetical protein
VGGRGTKVWVAQTPKNLEMRIIRNLTMKDLKRDVISYGGGRMVEHIGGSS